jgi:hypothetical protein
MCLDYMHGLIGFANTSSPFTRFPIKLKIDEKTNPLWSMCLGFVYFSNKNFDRPIDVKKASTMAKRLKIS